MAAQSAYWPGVLNAAVRCGGGTLSTVAVGAGLAGQWNRVTEALERLGQPADPAKLTVLAATAARGGQWGRAASYACGAGRPDTGLAAEAVGRTNNRFAINQLVEYYMRRPTELRRAELLAAAIGGLAHTSRSAINETLEIFDEPLHRALALIRVASALAAGTDRTELREALTEAAHIGSKENPGAVIANLWLDLARIATRAGWPALGKSYLDQAEHTLRAQSAAPTAETYAALARAAWDCGDLGGAERLLKHRDETWCRSKPGGGSPGARPRARGEARGLPDRHHRCRRPLRRSPHEKWGAVACQMDRIRPVDPRDPARASKLREEVGI